MLVGGGGGWWWMLVVGISGYIFAGGSAWWHILVSPIMKEVTLEGFLKKHRDVSKTIATAMMELFVALVSSFQPLTNFTKN